MFQLKNKIKMIKIPVLELKYRNDTEKFIEVPKQNRNRNKYLNFITDKNTVTNSKRNY